MIEAAYNSNTIYSRNDVATFDSVRYASLVDVNKGNMPTTSPTFWALAKPVGYVAPAVAPVEKPAPDFDAKATYKANDPVTFNGVRFVSHEDSNTGHTPDASPNWWAIAEQIAPIGSIVPDAWIAVAQAIATSKQATAALETAIHAVAVQTGGSFKS
jgi:hypothetical protein